MLIAIHGVMLYAHCYTWSEALCALNSWSDAFSHCYTWSEALCSFV